VVGAAIFMLLCSTVAAAPKAGSVDITGKTTKKALKEGKKTKQYHIAKDSFDFSATGPVNLMIVVNVSRDKDFSGTRSLDITRNGEFVSANEFSITKGKVTYGKAPKAYRPLIVAVPKGSHIYRVAWKDAPAVPLLVRLAKVKKMVAVYAAAPEQAIAKEKPADEAPPLVAVPLVPLAPVAEPKAETAAQTTPEAPKAEAPAKAPQKEQSAQKEDTARDKPAATEPAEAKASKEAEDEPGLKYVSVAAKVNVLIPTSRVDTTWAFHADIRYILPWWNPNISIGLDIGYYPTSGSGQNLDPQIGLYDFDWKIHSLPMYFGPQVDIPIPGVPWLYLNAETGFSMIVAWSEGHTFDGTNKASDIAYGYYVGGGLEFRFGKFGGVTAVYRHTGIYLDFDYPEFNRELGNLGGSSVLVGYRYIF